MQNHHPYLLHKIRMCCPKPTWRSYMMVFVLWFSLSPIQANCQSEEMFDEVSLVLNVQRVGSIEISAIIFKQEAYLPVKEIFDFLRIRNVFSNDMDQISGYIINTNNSFIIDKSKNQVMYAGQIYPVNPGDIIQTESNLYLKSNYFGEIFGLICTFNFRSLSVALTTKIELPIIREMQQELIRKNIGKLRGEKQADTLIGRTFELLKPGVADWSVISSQQSTAPSNTRVNLSLGGIVLGGEANVFLSHTVSQPFDLKAQFANWRFVNNKSNVLRQVSIGRIAPLSKMSIFAPVNGVQISNTPTSGRRSYGTYTLSNKTEPDWMVELYINNVLVNFMKADASGFYSFEIPMLYGSSEIKLRFYGPWGEERVSEQFVNIPFNFIPLQQFEYTASGGIVSDTSKSRFGSAKFGYGLSRRLTVGGGVEYMSSTNNGIPIPYVNASVRIGSRLLVTGEKMYAVKSGGAVSYRSPNKFQVDFNYTKYSATQTAIQNNFIEEKKLVLSKSFRTKKYSGFTRFTINDFTLLKSKMTRAEMLTSVIKGRFSTNMTNYVIRSNNKASFFSNLSTSFYTPVGIRFTQQLQYDYRNRNFNMIRVEAEKMIYKKAFVNVSYQKNLINNSQMISLGLRYNFSFAQTFLNATQSNKNFTATQTVRGSLLYENTTRYLGFSDQGNLGRGGIIVAPFLDLNCNGDRDEDEPKVAGLHLRINGGRVVYNEKDTSIRITGLEAYNNYIIELDKNGFENIAWRISNKTIGVEIMPNHFERIEVPVAVYGEVSGTVTLVHNNETKGIGRILVNINNANTGKLMTRVLTEADGYYNFVGLAPGKYTASVDADQLKKLNITSPVAYTRFTIKKSIEGDIVEGIDFEIIKGEDISRK